MNPALAKQASDLVLNAHVLVNLVSRRVRQLNSGDGRQSRALVADTANLSAADIALREIIEGKMGYEMPASVPLTRPTARNRNRPKHWGSTEQQARHDA
jgi:DNA-directed RNA polymerase subunit omega